MNFDKIWREITDINIFGLIFADVRDLPWISRLSTAKEEKHHGGKPRLHRPPATETCLELGETGFQPALST